MTAETIVQRTRRELREDLEYSKTVRKLAGEEPSFGLNLKQYIDQEPETRDAYRVQPVSRMNLRLWVYQLATCMTSFPTHINCKATDREEDPYHAELMQWALQHDVINRGITNGWKETRKRVYGAALAMRVGACRLDWRPEVEDRGAVIPRFVDWRNLYFPRPYLWPHDPLNPRLTEVCRMSMDELARMKNWDTQGLQPDDGSEYFHEGTGETPEAHDPNGRIDLNAQSASEGKGAQSGMVTVAIRWSRFDETKGSKPVPLPEGERYQQCIRCAYRGPRQDSIHTKLAPFEPAGCVMCGGGDMVLITKRVVEDGLRYPMKKRLSIVAVNGSMEKPIYDDKWPAPRCPFFPYMWLPRFAFPHDPIPESDISSNWSTTLATNFTRRVIYEQAHRSRPITMVPAGMGVTDRSGHRFDPDSADDDLGFYTRDVGPDAIKIVQAQPVSEALFQLQEMLAADFREHEGSGDISMRPEQSRDIAASSLELQIESGNTPINMFGQDGYDAESVLYTCWASYIQEFWTDETWIDLRGPEGAMERGAIVGMDLPSVDATVNAGPKWTAAHKQQMEAYQMWRAIDPLDREWLGPMMGVDQILIERMNAADAKRAAMQQQAAMQGAGMTVPEFPTPQNAPQPAAMET